MKITKPPHLPEPLIGHIWSVHKRHTAFFQIPRLRLIDNDRILLKPEKSGYKTFVDYSLGHPLWLNRKICALRYLWSKQILEILTLLSSTQARPIPGSYGTEKHQDTNRQIPTEWIRKSRKWKQFFNYGVCGSHKHVHGLLRHTSHASITKEKRDWIPEGSAPVYTTLNGWQKRASSYFIG